MELMFCHQCWRNTLVKQNRWISRCQCGYEYHKSAVRHLYDCDPGFTTEMIHEENS